MAGTTRNLLEPWESPLGIALVTTYTICLCIYGAVTTTAPKSEMGASGHVRKAFNMCTFSSPPLHHTKLLVVACHVSLAGLLYGLDTGMLNFPSFDRPPIHISAAMLMLMLHCHFYIQAPSGLSRRWCSSECQSVGFLRHSKVSTSRVSSSLQLCPPSHLATFPIVSLASTVSCQEAP